MKAKDVFSLTPPAAPIPEGSVLVQDTRGRISHVSAASLEIEYAPEGWTRYDMDEAYATYLACSTWRGKELEDEDHGIYTTNDKGETK